MSSKTDELRAVAEALGLRVTHGYTLPGGRRVNEENVTTLWAREGDASTSLTFEEDEDGHLWCEDDLTPLQALMLAMVARRAR
jgi:hypothetical protein